MKDLAIYGAGGYGREVACLIKAINNIRREWNLIGFFDDGLPFGEKNEYGKILGGIDKLNKYHKELSIAIAIGNPKVLKLIVDKIINKNILFPNIIAPDVIFMDRNNITLGKGNIIGFRSVISCNVFFQNFNILNTDIILGHDVKIGSYNMFNPSVRISGEVEIGNNNFFGVNSIVLQKKRIGNFVTVGANSLIIKNTKNNNTYIGNPATQLKY